MQYKKRYNDTMCTTDWSFSSDCLLADSDGIEKTQDCCYFVDKRSTLKCSDVISRAANCCQQFVVTLLRSFSFVQIRIQISWNE